MEETQGVLKKKIKAVSGEKGIATSLFFCNLK
jgi:hypothetical protein